jgi:hypothetical protein
MHLDSDGSRKKAEHVASFIRSAIERDSTAQQQASATQ